MCGIAGIWGIGDKRVARRMAAALSHRGPDDAGFFVDELVSLAHRRLSVIDIGTGKQPIFNEDGSIAVILNGEIYNFMQLRKELEAKGHVFKTGTDTEVIPHLYEERGISFVRALEGMFAIALYDSVRKLLVLARDRVGIKPLFYARSGPLLLFGSEMKALFRSGLVSPALHPDAVRERFVFADYLLRDHTFFKDVRQLLPGHILVIQEDGEVLLPYARSAYGESGIGEASAAGEVLRLLTESVRSQLVSDVPVGTFLSGGLDSSIIAALHRRIAGDGDVRTFSITDGSVSADARNARLLARRIGSIHREISFSAEDIVTNLPAFIYHEENIDYGMMFNFFLSRETKKEVTVVLSGNGSDELFAGYDRFKDIPLLRRRMMRRWSVSGLSGSRQYLEHIQALQTPADLLRFEQLQGQLANFQMQWVDRTSMAFGLEVRVPFLSTSLMTFVNTLPTSMKLRNGVEKYILRKAVAGLDIPREIVRRPKFPAGLANTAPQAIPRFERFCGRLVGRRKPRPYDRYLDTDARKLCFDLLRHIFVENQGEAPHGLALSDIC